MCNQNVLKINFAGDSILANNIYNYFISNSKIKKKVKLEEDNIIVSINREHDKNVIKHALLRNSSR